jgi:glycosyltransferase involved in cell wall biosynthesis
MAPDQASDQPLNQASRQDARQAATLTTPVQLLAVSFAFPPLAYPRSIQVARLLKHLEARTALVCADESGARRDDSAERDAEPALTSVVRVPFSVSRARREANRFAFRLRRSLWNRWNLAPDQYRPWVPRALGAVANTIEDGFRPQVLATFSQPATCHLVGLEIKERYGLPWVAHFSDPWVGNPFHDHDAATAARNAALERRVIERADRLIFTSAETVDMVMSRYPAAARSKARVLPQCFDASQYEAESAPGGERGDEHDKEREDQRDNRRDPAPGQLTLRHLGTFYGRRSPVHLFRAVTRLLASDPSMLEGVRFEFFGVSGFDVMGEAGGDALPEGMLKVGGAVSYRESLSLMLTADGLLILDAPAEKSVFLPSKLIDYIGAGRPVLGLTPEGAARSLIQRLGGWVADPADDEASARALASFLTFLRQRPRQERQAPWGDSRVRAEYEASRLARQFDDILKELLD